MDNEISYNQFNDFYHFLRLFQLDVLETWVVNETLVQSTILWPEEDLVHVIQS